MANPCPSVCFVVKETPNTEHRTPNMEHPTSNGCRAVRTGLCHQLVPDAVDGQEMFGFAAVVAELFPELYDHLVQGACRPVIIVTPDLIQQFVPRQHFARARVKKLEQL